LAKLNLMDKRIVTSWMEKNGVDIVETPAYYEMVRKKRIKFRYDETGDLDRETAYKQFIEYLCSEFKNKKV